MQNDAVVTIREFLNALKSMMEPVEGGEDYGNLRKQVSDWEDEKGKMTNVALIYETPGGSTNQINVSFRYCPPAFWMLNETTGVEEEILEPEEVLQRIQKLLAEIPDKRRVRLRATIEEWRQQGKSQAEIFAALKDLMYSDFKGARITKDELQEATRFTIEILRGPKAAEG